MIATNEARQADPISDSERSSAGRAGIPVREEMLSRDAMKGICGGTVAQIPHDSWTSIVVLPIASASGANDPGREMVERIIWMAFMGEVAALWKEARTAIINYGQAFFDAVLFAPEADSSSQSSGGYDPRPFYSY